MCKRCTASRAACFVGSQHPLRYVDSFAQFTSPCGSCALLVCSIPPQIPTIRRSRVAKAAFDLVQTERLDKLPAPMKYKTALLAFSLAFLLASPFRANAQSAWIQGFGQFGTGSNSAGVAMSADGSVVAGSALTVGNTFSSQRPVLWTSPGPAALAPDVPVGWTGFSRFNDLSGDGTVGTGVRLGGSFRWTSTGGFEDIPFRTATGISANGTTIVGESGDGRAALWTVGGGLNAFGPSSSYANAANSNGTIVVGIANTNIAALWDLSGSPTQRLLGTLPGGTESDAMSVSGDGSIVVGRSLTGTGAKPFRWTLETGMVELGSSNPNDFVSSVFVSGNGQYILGANFTTSEGFIWTELAGMTSVESYLLSGNVDLTGWSNVMALSITDDGRYLTGGGTYEGLTQGFVAEVVPEPSTYALLALSAAGVGAHVLRRRRK